MLGVGLLEDFTAVLKQTKINRREAEALLNEISKVLVSNGGVVPGVVGEGRSGIGCRLRWNGSEFVVQYADSSYYFKLSECVSDETFYSLVRHVPKWVKYRHSLAVGKEAVGAKVVVKLKSLLKR